MIKPMDANRLEYLETRLLVQAELCHDAQEACRWIRRLRLENGLLDGEKRWLSKKLKGHEAAMRKALSLVEYMANNWPGCACDSEDKCNIHLVEGILRTSLEKL